MSQSPPRILLVDDDPEIQLFLRRVLTREGFDITACSSGAEALSLLKNLPYEFDLVLSDVKMPSIDGLTLVQRIKDLGKNVPIVLMTAYGTIQSAVEAIKRGAHDYLPKPVQINDLLATVRKVLEYRSVTKASVVDEPVMRERTTSESSSTLTASAGGASFGLGNLIGQDQQMKDIFSLIRRIAKVDSTVLILGESGTGKEVIAQSIHNSSPRRSKNFVAINCAAIPDELLESELFGHAKGSFTGATAQKKGLFEEAEGGTIFLDEIGDMPMTLQAKLLRVLQERKIRPVGSTQMKDIDVRIVAATHRDLRKMVLESDFREDLYYRLSVVPLVVPPLRERQEDIPLLAEYFLKKYLAKMESTQKTLSQEALLRLKAYSWKGNVRELENVIERSVILTQNAVIDTTDLKFLDETEEPAIISAALSNGASNGVVLGAAGDQKSLDLRDLEKEALLLALQKSGGRKEEAAKILGISRKTLYRKEREYGIAPL